jgi:hypothetical protein
VDLDARNSSGKTLLHLCAESRFPADNLVREVIALGADTSMFFNFLKNIHTKQVMPVHFLGHSTVHICGALLNFEKNLSALG